MSDVLVTAGEEVQGLNIARLLGSRGLRVIVGGCEKNSLGFYSRYAHDSFVYPSPRENLDGFIQAVIQHAKLHQVKLIFPANESSMICLDRFREKIESVAPLIAPASNIIELAVDKLKTLEIAKKLNLPIPPTVAANSLEETVDSANQLGYPVVMKPRGSRYHAKLPGKLYFKVDFADSKEMLVYKLTKYCKEGVYPIIQKYIPGVSMAISVLTKNGDPVGIYQYRFNRHLPVTGGIGIVRESVPLDPKAKDYSIRLLKAMNWTGPAMVEFRYNPQTKDYVLMEVNARVQASIGIGRYLGMNLPYMAYQLFMGEEPTKVENYRVGVRYRWLRGDIRSLRQYYTGETTRNYINNPLNPLPSKAELLWDFIKDFHYETRYESFSLTDPMPVFIEAQNILIEQLGSLYLSLRKKNLQANPSTIQ